MLKERYELFVHYDLSDVDMEEGFDDTLIIERIHCGGFKRRIITNHKEWGNIILRSKRRQGWVEAEYCNSKEEELNNNWEAIGPRMTDFCHLGPDKEDCHVEYKYRNEGTEHNWVRERDSYRKYEP